MVEEVEVDDVVKSVVEVVFCSSGGEVIIVGVEEEDDSCVDVIVVVEVFVEVELLSSSEDESFRGGT